jgi:serine protease
MIYSNESLRSASSFAIEPIVPIDTAGNTLTEALSLGRFSATLQDSTVLTEFVGNDDPRDIYQFDITRSGKLSITLDQLSEDADLTLIQDINQNSIIDRADIISKSLRPSIEIDRIQADYLAPGRYFIAVTPVETNTAYRLSLATDPTNEIAYLEGNLLANTFQPDLQRDRTFISGNGNSQFGQDLFDTIDLSTITFDSINLNLANLNQGGISANPGNGSRQFDAINLSDNRQILFEGIDRIQFADRTLTLAITPNDPLFQDQWHLHTTSVHQAWRFTTGNDRVLIGIGDSGLAIDENNNLHPDLTPPQNFDRKTQEDFEDQRNIYNTNPLSSHGTAIHSIIAAQSNNNIGIAGINWNTTITDVDLLGGDRDDLTLINGVKTLIDRRQPDQKLIINLSLESRYGINAELEAIVRADNPDILFVIASGNSGRDRVAAPARLAKDYKNVIAVGAVDRLGNHMNYSNYGAGLTLTAPANITTAEAVKLGDQVLFQYTDRASGTSVSTPQVSGIASLVWSANPNLTASQVSNILAQSSYDLGEPGRDPRYGNGLINADRAIRLAIAQPPTANPPKTVVTPAPQDIQPS